VARRSYIDPRAVMDLPVENTESPALENALAEPCAA
jgi:hypothetical protein